MNKTNSEELKSLKKDFEANLLDGDAIQTGQMISSEVVWEWAEQAIITYFKTLSEEVIGKDEEPQNCCNYCGMKECCGGGIPEERNELKSEQRTRLNIILKNIEGVK